MTFVRPTYSSFPARRFETSMWMSSSSTAVMDVFFSHSDIIYGNKSASLLEWLGGFTRPLRPTHLFQQTNLFTWPQHLCSHKSAGLLCLCTLAVFFFFFRLVRLSLRFCVHINSHVASISFSPVWPDPVCPFRNISSWRRIGCFLIRGVPRTSIKAAGWMPGDLGL